VRFFGKATKITTFALPDKRRCFSMLIIPIKEGENIDRALKKFKKKFERTGTMKQLRGRQNFTKPSVKRRDEVLKAAYRERMRSQEENA